MVGDNMFLAAYEGDAQAVVTWLDEGGGVDARCAEQDGTTLLIGATWGGHEAMVRMLLQRGASVNLQGYNGRGTALMAAAATGRITIVQVLLDAKADASLQSISGKTALMKAEQEKQTETAQMLRQHAKPQAPERPEDPMYGTLSNSRVRITGLKGRPELNGRSGVATYFDAAKGRYEVAVEGEAEAVLLKPENLQEALEPTLS